MELSRKLYEMHVARLHLVVCATLFGCGDADYVAIRNVPPEVPRLAMDGHVNTGMRSAFDFDVVGDTVFVLDWKSNRVVPLVHKGSQWSEGLAFGKRGSKPGELMEPIAIAFDSAKQRLVILERTGEAELYDVDGQYSASELYNIPCPTARAEFFVAANAYYIAQRCPPVRFSALHGDTLYVLLARLFHDQVPRLIAALPTTNLSGSWGSAFSAAQPAAIVNNAIAFGSGLSNCVLLYRGDRAFASRCDSSGVEYDAPKPRRFGANDLPDVVATRWPHPLPFYAFITSADSDLIAIRAISADSFALHTIGKSRLPFLVAPMVSFVGCKQAGCLWLDLTIHPAGVTFLDRNHLSAFARRR